MSITGTKDPRNPKSFQQLNQNEDEPDPARQTKPFFRIIQKWFYKKIINLFLIFIEDNTLFSNICEMYNLHIKMGQMDYFINKN
jgi:hypothetical protein